MPDIEVNTAGVVGVYVEAPLSSVNTSFASEQPFNQNNPVWSETLSILPAHSDFLGK